jgi:hypothetical protein
LHAAAISSLGQVSIRELAWRARAPVEAEGVDQARGTSQFGVVILTIACLRFGRNQSVKLETPGRFSKGADGCMMHLLICLQRLLGSYSKHEGFPASDAPNALKVEYVLRSCPFAPQIHVIQPQQ